MTLKIKKIYLAAGILASVISACLGLETQHSNHLGWALLFVGTGFTVVAAITLGILFLQEPEETQSNHGWLWLPAFGMLVMSLVTPLEYLYLPPVLARSDHLQDIGLILVAGGLCFYLVMLRTPAANTNTARPRTGMGAWLCRPAFASLVLFALGLSIGYSSLIGLLVALLMVLPGLVRWMRLEDQNQKLIH